RPERIPPWRRAAAVLILIGLIYFLAMFAPYYIRNFELQSFVSDLTRRAENLTASDESLRTQVVEKAHQLTLPVTEDEVHVPHPQDGMRVDIRYFVRVDLPGYTVNLHFYPGAGTR